MTLLWCSKRVVSWISSLIPHSRLSIKKSSTTCHEPAFCSYGSHPDCTTNSKEPKELINQRYKYYDAKNPGWFKSMHEESIPDLYKFTPAPRCFDPREAVRLDLAHSKQFTPNGVFRVNLDQTSLVSGSKLILQEFPINSILQEIDDHLEDNRYQFRDSLLYRCLKQDRFDSLSDVFQLSNLEPLGRASKFNAFFPWDCGKHDLNQMQDFKIHEEKYCGVLSDNSIAMHFIKFRRLLESVKRNGILPYEKSLVEGFLMSKEGKLRFVATRGTHRVLVFRYLGHQEAFAKKDRFYGERVDVADIESWHFLRNGFISKEDAVKIFDCFFDQPLGVM